MQMPDADKSRILQSCKVAILNEHTCCYTGKGRGVQQQQAIQSMQGPAGCLDKGLNEAGYCVHHRECRAKTK